MMLRLLQILFRCKLVGIPFDDPETFNNIGSVTYKFVWWACYFREFSSLSTINIYNLGLGLFIHCELYYLEL
jgi:hypothetical protein